MIHPSGHRSAKDSTCPSPDPKDKFPVQMSIPGIHLTSSVVNVGVNEYGEMDVPDGQTMNVDGIRTASFREEKGSAVFDAHVYAAFKNLRMRKWVTISLLRKRTERRFISGYPNPSSISSKTCLSISCLPGLMPNASINHMCR